MNRFAAAVLHLFLTTIALGQEKPVTNPPQLVKLRTDYIRASQREGSAVTAKYVRDLEALKQRYSRESKLQAGAAVERELRSVMEANKPKPREGAAPKGRRVTVQCYIEENFKGREYRIEGPAEYVTAAAAGIPNDKLASMKMPPGIVVTLFGNSDFKGNSERYTGEVSSVGPMLGKTTSLTIAYGDAGGEAAAQGGDAPELSALTAEYQAELKRATVPSLTAYRRNLQALKEQFTRESKFEAALAVEHELQKISEPGQ
jgi:hypothetical protein